ncbi:DoxX family protein [Streptomyces rubiginosohelvolus]
MLYTAILACLVASIFVTFGTQKIRAVPRMKMRAAYAGYSVRAYRVIGTLEVAGAASAVVGLVLPLLGALAGAGLLALMTGAVFVHWRNGDGARGVAPAALCALPVVGYLAGLYIVYV